MYIQCSTPWHISFLHCVCYVDISAGSVLETYGAGDLQGFHLTSLNTTDDVFIGRATFFAALFFFFPAGSNQSTAT